MKEYTYIISKLDQFIKKYYGKMLIKGSLLFLGFGILLFLLVLGLEYFLWLSSAARTVLFVVFLALAFVLLVRYIVIPLFYLFKLKNGISPKVAAQMIGKHFPEVDDKLVNLLDLANNPETSELLLASISQKSIALQRISFTNAISYKDALPYAKYSIIPIVILIIIWLSGNWDSFSSSYERVMNYEIAYEKPAPFRFTILTPQLETLADQAFTVQVTTQGSVKPENVFIEIDGNNMLLQKNGDKYEYTFTPPVSTTRFTFTANEVRSREYELSAIATPYIIDFKMLLNYPSYIGKKKEVLFGTGNAVVPEGTRVTWELSGEHIDTIHYVKLNKKLRFKKEESTFSLSQTVYNTLDYELRTSNQQVANYEKLRYGIKVVKDDYPSIKVRPLEEVTKANEAYYAGTLTDDYGLKELSIVHYEVGDEENKTRVVLKKLNKNFDQFYYTYPSGFKLEQGKTYRYYFEVMDNDALHGGKKRKSQVFETNMLDANELDSQRLEDQQSLLKDLDKSMQKAQEQKETLQNLENLQKENRSLNFNEQMQLKDFLKNQELQEEQMQKFSQELQKNLAATKKDSKLNQLLQERLERQKIQAKKNEQLLKELNKIADKIDKQELTKKLEDIGKKQQNSSKSLEQLVELTKRYYVTEKAAQLADALKALSEKQEKLSEQNNEETAHQEQLIKDFNKIAEELEQLSKDNKALKKPIDLKIDTKKKERIKSEQQKALEGLSKAQQAESNSEAKENSKKESSKRQKSAAQKMQEMSEDLSASSAGGGGESAAEDAEVLRQILDNLIVFSFKQEALFNKLKENNEQDANQYSQTVRSQQELRGLFTHVDDSLFALSLRQAELSEFVNEQITEVYYNIDKSLATMADGQIYQSISYQKYVVTAANSLADFLVNVLENMQESMKPGQGSGKSNDGFQLPDIIKGQEQLGEKLGQQGSDGKEGEKGQEGKEGEKGQEGKEGEKGQEGKEGEQGKEGQQGKEGNQGKQGNGKQGKEGAGQSGNGGESGKGKKSGSKGKMGDGQGNAGEGNGQQGKNGDGKGKGPNGTTSGAGGMSEEELKEVYEIYQEQQALREALEKQLKNMIRNDDRSLGEKLIRQMEDFENDLLENGITQRTINKANTIQYELLKLENAALKQGQKQERESNTNTKDYSNPILSKPAELENYRNELEILNRQALPLRQNFRNKVKTYFKTNDSL